MYRSSDPGQSEVRKLEGTQGAGRRLTLTQRAAAAKMAEIALTDVRIKYPKHQVVAFHILFADFLSPAPPTTPIAAKNAPLLPSPLEIPADSLDRHLLRCRVEMKQPGASTRVLHYRDSPTTADSIISDSVSSHVGKEGLRWFDKLFYRADGPANWANARLVCRRLCRAGGISGAAPAKVGSKRRLRRGWDCNLPVQDTRGGLAGKERDLWQRPAISAMAPSKKSLQRERDRINELTDRRQSHTPLPTLLGRLNRQLKGRANYFSQG